MSYPPKITNIKNHIVQQQDVENLITLLDKELEKKSPTHQSLKDREIKQISKEVVQNIFQERSGQLSKIDSIKRRLQGHVAGQGNLLKEFINKVKALFRENIISKKIDKKAAISSGSKGMSR